MADSKFRNRPGSVSSVFPKEQIACRYYGPSSLLESMNGPLRILNNTSDDLHVAQMTVDNEESLFAGSKLGINIDESVESVLSAVRALTDININSAGGNQPGQYSSLEQALVDYIDHPRYHQEVNELLDMALNLQGLSPDAAYRRTRYV